MPLRAATLLLLPFLVCSFAGYAAPTASPASQLIVQAISGGPPPDSLASSFEQMFLSGVPVGITPGLPTSFSELLPPSAVAFGFVIDRADTEHGRIVLPLLAILILLFGMMAMPLDALCTWQPGPLRTSVQQTEIK